jgi:membrane-bound lytic murein transglycosylase B
MNIRKIYIFAFTLLVFSGCSTKTPEKKELNENNKSIATEVKVEENRTKEPIGLTVGDDEMNIESPILLSTPSSISSTPSIDTRPTITTNSPTINIPSPSYDELQGDFQGNSELTDFIEMMVTVHNFKRSELNRIFSQAQNYQYIPQNRTYTTNSAVNRLGRWDRYRKIFIYEKNIQRGIDFWNNNADALQRAEDKYGVPAEYIVGIIGVETAYGTNFGKHRVIDVLTTKAVTGHRRSNFYRDELEKYIILTRDAGLVPTELMGSTSGALGYGQFMPSSYIRFAVDFNNDGAVDLWNVEDAIGSVANYFAENGWKSSISQVAVRAKYNGNRFSRLKTGYKTKYSQSKLRRKYKIKPRSKMYYRGSVSLIKLNRTNYDELWFGTHNFRVITRYNHSSHYGMVVHQLAQAVKSRVGF